MSAIIRNISDFPNSIQDHAYSGGYSLLPSLPGGGCGCSKGERFYVALSWDLNARAFEHGAGGLKPYVFKIGSTKMCSDRVKSLNEFRKQVGSKASPWFREPAYAGCTDWKILKCWDVTMDRYDDREFKPWLATVYDPKDVCVAGSRSFAGVAGLNPDREFEDLCIMSEDFVRARSKVRANHPLHEEMLSAVADVLIFLGGEFAAYLKQRDAG
jgi:hypothetical protein